MDQRQWHVMWITAATTVLITGAVVGALRYSVRSEAVAAVSNIILPSQGDSAIRGGRPNIRKPIGKQTDDPRTTNDERNDQPLYHFGTKTLHVRNVRSGNSYPVDAGVEDSSSGGYELRRLYFLKGGWVDFDNCELDDDYLGICTDEGGRDWEIEGDG